MASPPQETGICTSELWLCRVLIYLKSGLRQQKLDVCISQYVSCNSVRILSEKKVVYF